MPYNFESLQVYKQSLKFVGSVYKETDTWDKKYLYNLADQLRRASLSILLNIAEGTSRSKKDFNHFLTISYGSCFECLACFDVALEINVSSASRINALKTEISMITKMLSGLKKYLNGVKLTTKN